MSRIHDALVALRPSKDLSDVNISRLAKWEGSYRKVGLGSGLNDASNKAQQTAGDVLNLQNWLDECSEILLFAAPATTSP